MFCMGIRSGERRERQGDRGFRDRPWAKVWERSSEEVRAEAVLSFSFYPGQQPGISSKGTQRASGRVARSWAFLAASGKPPPQPRASWTLPPSDPRAGGRELRELDKSHSSVESTSEGSRLRGHLPPVSEGRSR